MKKANKKGFTIVELVIVIAVVAILAAVLIPTFVSVTKRANESKDTQLVRNLNTALAVDTEVGKHETMQSALEAAAKAGYDVAKINTSATDNEILWDSKNDCFVYKKDSGIEYIPNSVSEEQQKAVKNYQYWIIASTPNATYSTYLYDYKGSGTETVTTGLDVGNETVAAITYKNDTANAQEVVIRTNGGTNVTVDADLDTVYHYGKAGSVEIIKCAMASYHEYGEIKGNITIKHGHVRLESGSKINSIILDTDSINNVAVTQSDSAEIEGTIVATNEQVKKSLKDSENIVVDSSVLTNIDNVEIIDKNITIAEFISKVGSGKHCVFISDIQLNGEINLNKKEVNIDLNGYTFKLTNSSCPIILSNQTNAKIQNGKMVVNAAGAYVATVKIEDGSKFELSDVDYLTNSSGLYPDSKSELLIRNCTVNAGGYGLGTNASKAQVNSPLINISIYDSAIKTNTNDNDNTAVCLNVPVVAYFENSEFSAGRQAVMVRGGTATFKNCTLTTSGEYSDLTKYIDTIWGSGNEVPAAALTIGNRGKTSYDYPTIVALIDTKLVVLSNVDTAYALYAYGETKSNYNVSISYNNNCLLGRTNLDESIGNVSIKTI